MRWMKRGVRPVTEKKARAGWKGREGWWGREGMEVCANDMVICTQWSSDVIKAVI